MKRAVWVSLFFAGLAAADSFSGTVVDIICRGKDLAGHTRECAIACVKSGYGDVLKVQSIDFQ